ncbi:maleylpyruvate isomerase N-terminal domain-containing protein [Actinoplanes sp. NPDC051851]|uniref:maleylpyruvate isomerase N-terminal domain-containing protein n=1 Tax=Actinoplanes sp. NPDC051851 TaxID=3154753 RepID=UPI003447FAB7
MTIDPLVLMTDVEEATEALLRTMAALDDAAIGAPSLLPGWTAGHVLTHLARNADGYNRLLTWARTGVETPMYPSREARDAEIEAGAARPAAEHFADIRDAHERLADAAAAMPVEAWAFVLPPLGRSAAIVPWNRLREVAVHHVDLALDHTPEEWTDGFALRLLREFAGDPPAGTPAMVLHPAGAEHPLVIGAADGPAVGGPSRSLAAWLIGRADGAGLTVSPDGELPRPARWR